LRKSPNGGKSKLSTHFSQNFPITKNILMMRDCYFSVSQQMCEVSNFPNIFPYTIVGLIMPNNHAFTVFQYLLSFLSYSDFSEKVPFSHGHTGSDVTACVCDVKI
jgi:hypothetical protein